MRFRRDLGTCQGSVGELFSLPFHTIFASSQLLSCRPLAAGVSEFVSSRPSVVVCQRLSSTLAIILLLSSLIRVQVQQRINPHHMLPSQAMSVRTLATLVRLVPRCFGDAGGHMRTLPLHLFKMFAFAVAARKVVDFDGVQLLRSITG